MNADDIFKKYVLKVEEPKPELKIPFGGRQSGRTSRTIVGLTPGSIYVCHDQAAVKYIGNMAKNELGRRDLKTNTCDIGLMSMSAYLNGAYFTGVRVTKGQMVVFDHMVYEGRSSSAKYNRWQDVNNQACAAGYYVIFDEKYYNKIHQHS